MDKLNHCKKIGFSITKIHEYFDHRVDTPQDFDDIYPEIPYKYTFTDNISIRSYFYIIELINSTQYLNAELLDYYYRISTLRTSEEEKYEILHSFDLTMFNDRVRPIISNLRNINLFYSTLIFLGLARDFLTFLDFATNTAF